MPCPAGSDFDCCYACASGYLLWPSCVPACDITHAYLEGGARGCKACPAGQIQNRSTATTCVFCADLPEYGPNFYATSYGCARCSSLSYATPRPYATGCTPCASGEYVPSGTAACTRCPAGSVLKTTATWAATCAPCPAGTAPDAAGVSCTVCAADTYAPRAGSIACAPCPTATQTHGGNRTGCTPCPPLWNATLVEYVAGGGCAVICAPGTYAVTSPYLPGGCHACTAANELVGTYARTPGAPPTVSAMLALRQHL